MKKTFLLCAIALFGILSGQAQYNYLENTDGQHGRIILGDVDNDGDLDIFIFGEQRDDPHSQRGGLYINDGAGNFTKKDCPAMPGWTGAVDFGDINGDGFIDLIFSGHKNGGVPEANARGMAINDGTGTFTLADPNDYPGFTLRSTGAVFADFNNDGLLDYMLAAPDHQSHWDWELGAQVDYWGRWSIFFQQPDGTFVEDDLQFSSHFHDQIITVGDFDNDGDVDVFLQGYYPHNNPDITPFGLTGKFWIAAIFENDGNGNFSIKQGTELPAIGWGSHSWGDVDGNGFLDLLIVGDGFYNGNNNWDAAPWYNRLFANNNGVFTQIFEGPRARAFTWGDTNILQDLDNDGDVDILFGGWADNIGRQKTYVFANEYDGGDISQYDFEEVTLLGDEYLPGLSEQKYKVGDLNGDYILDYVWMGFKGGAAGFPPEDKIDVTIGGWTPGINEGDMITPFVQLTAPQNLSAVKTEDGDYFKVDFSWEAPVNIGTKKSVTYNLALKNTDTGKWLYNPMAFIGGEKDGWRQVSKMGNMYLNKSWSLTLPKANYEWTVQAVDAGFFGGNFAAKKIISTASGTENTYIFKPTILNSEGNLLISYKNGEIINAKVYTIDGVKIVDTQFKNELKTQLQPGVYIIELSNSKLNTYKTKTIVR